MAVAATAVGVLVLFSAQRALSPSLVRAFCAEPDCALGVGLWLIVGAVLAPLAALVVGVALRHGDRPVRRGLLVALCCVAAYLVESIVLWAAA
ncbi:hypothetical protein GCM10023108_14630 [Saccharopolyspora hordei]